MLEHNAAEEGSADKFVQKAKDKNSTARLMGFGHRVYKSYDPRAKILKRACSDVIERKGGSSRLLEIAMRLEEIALSDEYFVSRNLYPRITSYNVCYTKLLRHQQRRARGGVLLRRVEDRHLRAAREVLGDVALRNNFV